MIHVAAQVPSWAVAVAAPVGIFTTALIVGGIGAGLAGIAQHVKGFIEGNPWWEDPLGDLQKGALAFGTGVAGSLATAGLGSALGNAIGSTAAEAGAPAGASTAVGQPVSQALSQVAKHGLSNALLSGGLGAAQSAIRGENPLIGAATGAAGGIVGGIGQGIVGQNVPGAYQPIAGPPAPSQGMGADIGRAVSMAPTRALVAAPGVAGNVAAGAVRYGMTPGPPGLPAPPPYAHNPYPMGNPLFRYDRY